MATGNTPALETERLLLRRFREGNMAALLAIYGDEEANTFLPWFPLKTPEEAQHLYETRYAAAYRLPRGYRYAVCLKSDDVPVGYVHVSLDDSHDVGYGLRREFWHRGIATEACRAVAARLQQDGFGYITATHDVRNPRSGGVMKRLGMSYRYSYEEQWQPKDIPVTFRLYQLNFDGSGWVYRTYWERAAVRFVEKGV